MPHIIREVELPITDEQDRGKLVSIETDSAIPFNIKRVSYIWNVPTGRIRGGCANTIEQEFFICIRGRCSIKVSPDGGPLNKIIMNNPHRGIFIDTLVWYELTDFSPDAIVLCFSSTNYFPDNKISNREEFKKLK